MKRALKEPQIELKSRTEMDDIEFKGNHNA